MQFCCLRKIYQIALKIMLLPIQHFLPEFAFYHVYCQFAQIWKLQMNPKHPNISMDILHTVPYTVPKVLTRRICLTIKSFFFNDHFLYSHDLNVWFRGDTVKRNTMLVILRAQRVRADQKWKRKKIKNKEHFSSYILKECLTLVLCNMEKRIYFTTQYK